MNENLIQSLQAALRQENIDGWLFYSFRGSDPIATNILKLDDAQFATRRWFYYVPASGEPQRLVHAIESHTLDTLPGAKHVYLPWQQLHQHLRDILANARTVAMQYSPMNQIPYVSRVDAGTVELVRTCGVEVISSANLVQIFEAVWTQEQLETHLYAAKHMREIVDVVFKEVGRRVRESGTTELEIQDFLWQEFERRDLIAGHKPIVAINEHSADPHFTPNAAQNYPMREGDFLLIDMWTKKRTPHSVYDDITWTGYIGKAVPPEHENIFNVVRDGRDAGIRFVQEHYPSKTGTLFGSQVDHATRDSITRAGYGPYFIHRTGHSIHEEVHGNGANIDGLETQDQRRLIAGTCFSIEPGVYLPGKFGVRSEIDMYLAADRAIVTGLPVQTHVLPVLNL